LRNNCQIQNGAPKYPILTPLPPTRELAFPPQIEVGEGEGASRQKIECVCINIQIEVVLKPPRHWVICKHDSHFIGTVNKELKIIRVSSINEFAIGIIIVLAVSLSIFLTAETTGAIASEHEPQLIPSYAGFADVQATKNCFNIVGDTQSTSHWEFWRERNDRERKLIIDEIARCEPAFVIHPGDLTPRGGSEKHWQEFDEMHKEFREKKIPYFPTLGNHEFYGNDEKALQNYFERFPYLDKKRW